jgi:hypothetical protein
MDNAICGGAGSTLTGNALAAVKAAIFMGDPHNQNGLPYNVGTCKAGGVSLDSHNSSANLTNTIDSSLPAHPASSAHPPAPLSSSLTAILRTLTAAMATMPTLTSSTSTSTDPRLLPSSRPRSPHRCCASDWWNVKESQMESDQILRCKYLITLNETCTWPNECPCESQQHEHYLSCLAGYLA